MMSLIHVRTRKHTSPNGGIRERWFGTSFFASGNIIIVIQPIAPHHNDISCNDTPKPFIGGLLRKCPGRSLGWTFFPLWEASHTGRM